MTDMTAGTEINRIKEIYNLYDSSARHKILYSPFGRYSYFTISLIRKLFILFNQKNFLTLENKKILEIGSGSGQNFCNYFKFGLLPKDIFGIDLMYNRLVKAKLHYSNTNLFNSDGQNLPFQNKKFDLILQFVVFSSILDDGVCKNIASEMLRVLKDDGMIIWYDSHGGKMMSEHTRSYSKKQIKEFFPNCKYEFKRIIPHCQLSLRLSKYEWGLLALDIIEKIFPFLNCMQLCVITKESG